MAGFGKQVYSLHTDYANIDIFEVESYWDKNITMYDWYIDKRYIVSNKNLDLLQSYLEWYVAWVSDIKEEIKF